MYPTSSGETPTPPAGGKNDLSQQQKGVVQTNKKRSCPEDQRVMGPSKKTPPGPFVHLIGAHIFFPSGFRAILDEYHYLKS